MAELNSGDEILLQNALETPLQPVEWAPLAASGVNFYVKREDLVSPEASGNKFYKLFYNLMMARSQNISTVISFGGPYSNHLHALACVGEREGFRTVGIIRGERPVVIGPTLQDLEAKGMQLVYVSRADYRLKQTAGFQNWLNATFGPALTIPEGGANGLGSRGCMVITEAIEQQLKTQGSTALPLDICVATGTGTTAAGLLAAAGSNTRIHAFAVLKGVEAMQCTIESAARELNAGSAGRLCWHPQFHLGGYAKVTPELLSMMGEFEKQTGILLDPVYTAKMLWGIKELAKDGQWPTGANLVMVHTGGLQGRRGFNLDT